MLAIKSASYAKVSNIPQLAYGQDFLVFLKNKLSKRQGWDSVLLQICAGQHQKVFFN
jgi:hypothetical protein